MTPKKRRPGFSTFGYHNTIYAPYFGGSPQPSAESIIPPPEATAPVLEAPKVEPKPEPEPVQPQLPLPELPPPLMEPMEILTNEPQPKKPPEFKIAKLWVPPPQPPPPPSPTFAGASVDRPGYGGHGQPLPLPPPSVVPTIVPEAKKEVSARSAVVRAKLKKPPPKKSKLSRILFTAGFLMVVLVLISLFLLSEAH